MRRSRPLTTAAILTAVLAFSVGATSCGGGGSNGNPLVLVGFNLPNISGVVLNQPLIFTFSNDIDRNSYTPDTVRVVGNTSPFFETVVTDGNLMALLPRNPNFDDYTDAGLAWSDTYTVSLSTFPAPDTLRALDGRPLIEAETFTFNTLPQPAFIEPRRPIVHGLPPSAAGRSDDEGCLQNSDNAYFQGEKQSASTIGARILCLKNEGSPEVLLDECIPTHGTLDVGTPAVDPGRVDLPAIRVRLNEPLDPKTVTLFDFPTQLGFNVQLWRVGDTDKIPLSYMGPTPPFTQVKTNEPVINQSLTQTEIILVAAEPVLQGTYLVNITPAVTDLPGNPLRTQDRFRLSPSEGGFGAVEANVAASGKVPQGFRLYFVTLALPTTEQAFNESFSTNFAEWGDLASAGTEPGIYTYSDTGIVVPPGTDNLAQQIPGATLPAPRYTLGWTAPVAPPVCPPGTATPALTSGQTTTANWNNGFRFLGLLSLDANADNDGGQGRLKATWRPYTGDGGDGDFVSPGGGSSISLSTDVATGNSVNGDGMYEYRSFRLRAGDTMTVSGTRPLLLLCRGDFIVEAGATIEISGGQGGPGIDTDGSTLYTNTGALPAGGSGGRGGPGGGNGGAGANPVPPTSSPGGGPGLAARNLFEMNTGSGGLGGIGGDATNQGGGGGGFSALGSNGTDPTGTAGTNGGTTFGDQLFTRNLARFTPDRAYSPHANVSGGTGGGGGGADDDTGTSNTGNGTVGNEDDGGGGGGGGGGGINVIARSITIDGVIRANGGNGGNTYGPAAQVIDPGPDAMSTADDFVSDIMAGAMPSGQGGPGGGGSGGGILLVGMNGVTVGGTATLSAVGGIGGRSSASATNLVGGNGANGYITLMSGPAGPAPSVDGGASVTPAADTGTTYTPTIEDASVGQSAWVDMFVDMTDFQTAFWTDNFATLVGAGLVRGVDFDAVLEFQGASDLAPLPGGPTAPSTAVGLTQWDPCIDSIDNKRYIRWRWRFFVKSTFPGFGASPTGQPMPAILDQTIQFVR